MNAEPQPAAAPLPARAVPRALRVAGWNAALILAGLALVAVAGEAWLRLTTPSFTVSWPSRFVPGVGVLYEPHAEVRQTDGFDFWTTQRANGLGFLDREPPDPARAAASCHVAVIGDSFVDAREVAVADKLQVRLEALAAAALPELDVTTSAYGRQQTGQANQLPFYDEYARRLRPNLVALIVHHNDFRDSSAALRALQMGWDPARMPYAYPERAADGDARLRPPHPDFLPSSQFRWWGLELPASERWYETLGREAAERSLFARWLDGRRRGLIARDPRPSFAGRAALLAARPGYEWVLDGWQPTTSSDIQPLLLAEDPPPVFAEAIGDMAWALAEFKRRADRDGAALVVLATHHFGGAGARYTELLRGMTDPLGIPAISQHDWIVRAGGRLEDAHFPRDVGRHWTPQGHQWAAEALFDWLRRHPEVCED